MRQVNVIVGQLELEELADGDLDPQATLLPPPLVSQVEGQPVDRRSLAIVIGILVRLLHHCYSHQQVLTSRYRSLGRLQGDHAISYAI